MLAMLNTLLTYFILNVFSIKLFTAVYSQETCEKGFENLSKKYLLYDVNPGEGFNLRRDVFLRVANLVSNLNDAEPWVLVLPPWGNLYHWRNTRRDVYYKWSDFFDVQSIRRWIPVIELEEYIKDHGLVSDSAFVLQNFEDMWEKAWMDRYEVTTNCSGRHQFQQSLDGKWRAHLWRQQLTFKHFSCLSFQGPASTIVPFLTKDLRDSKSVFLDHGEILLHDEYGGAKYWSARRSMRFAPRLMKEANEFQRKFLDSDDERDRTQIPHDWRDFKPKRGSALGGPYLAIHMRRRDFIYARKNEVPSVSDVVKQLRRLKEKKLKLIFLATDAVEEDVKALRSQLEDFEVYTFTPSPSLLEEYGDGGIAIIDQIICSHARYFIGTYESTFSFRIQEEREIMGFPSETTFNRLCGENKSCEPPSQWKIVYS